MKRIALALLTVLLLTPGLALATGQPATPQAVADVEAACFGPTFVFFAAPGHPSLPFEYASGGCVDSVHGHITVVWAKNIYTGDRFVNRNVAGPDGGWKLVSP